MAPDLSLVIVGLVTCAFVIARLPDDHESCRAQHKIEVAKDRENQARLQHDMAHDPEYPVKSCPWCAK